jgi:Zn-finger nucleic acid-binding protein
MASNGDDGVLVCRHCGSSEQVSGLARQIEVVGETSRVCPTCTTLLSEGRLDGVPLNQCSRCSGLLIAMDRFVSLIEAARAHETVSAGVPPRRQSPGDRTISCPGCQRPMLSHFYGGAGNLVIDTCERCRLNWLDPGELRRIARAPETG